MGDELTGLILRAEVHLAGCWRCQASVRLNDPRRACDTWKALERQYEARRKEAGR